VISQELIRPYSLCSEPADRSSYSLAVLLEPASTGGSKYIHEDLRPGMVLEVAPPRNNFQLLGAPGYLLIAGGIGVTPLLPMAASLEAAGADWRMLYGGRRESSMAFLEQLAAYGEKVTIWPEDKYGLLNLKGAIEDLADGASVYCCGPEALINAVEEQCIASGREAPHVERFTARTGPAVASPGLGSDRPFEVVLHKSQKRFVVPVGAAIISVLKENRIFVPTSCTEGYCGVCETEVLSGIPDHRDEYLTAEKRAPNKTMMVCCGRSLTPELELNL
jgi:ferredoxin-NADP reductase